MAILDSVRQWLGIQNVGKTWRGHRVSNLDNANVSGSSYTGAERNRLLADWFHSSNSADNEIRYSLKTLRNRSRYLYRNDEYARSIINTLVNNIVGIGVQFQSQINRKSADDELNNKLNNAIESEWQRWGHSQHCDVSDQRSWADLQRQILRSMLVDGEILVRLVRREFGDSGIPLGIELIEADQLAEEGISEYQGNEVRMGVEVDRFHRPVAYHVFEKHPYDTYFSRSETARRKVRIPAEDIIHVYHPDRTYQTRGIPHLTPSILRMRHLGEYQQNELVASRFGSAVMGLVEQEADAQSDITADLLERIEGGSIRYLAPGEKFYGFAPNRPNVAYSGFIEAQLRALAVGNFLTYEQVSGDYSKVNYSSARVAQLEVRDAFRVLQNWYINKLHRRLFCHWLRAATLMGRIPLSWEEFSKNENYYCYANRFTPRGWHWVDPLKEVNAAIASINAGLTTATETIAEWGGDIENVIAVRARELEAYRKAGILLDMDGDLSPPDVSNT